MRFLIYITYRPTLCCPSNANLTSIRVRIFPLPQLVTNSVSDIRRSKLIIDNWLEAADDFEPFPASTAIPSMNTRVDINQTSWDYVESHEAGSFLSGDRGFLFKSSNSLFPCEQFGLFLLIASGLIKDIPTDLEPADLLSTPTPVPARKRQHLTPISQKAPSSTNTPVPEKTVGQSNNHLADQGGRTLHNGFPVANNPENITLLATSVLPDRLRSLFPFEYFNAMQSKAFQSIYEFDDNIVLSAPTGSGKTTCFELAIAKLMRTDQEPGTHKVVLH